MKLGDIPYDDDFITLTHTSLVTLNSTSFSRVKLPIIHSEKFKFKS